jgi:ABC-type bacteriocin/lantibiotic exporter with double-glycine peptidase domain
MKFIFSLPYRLANFFGWRSLVLGIGLLTSQERKKIAALSVVTSISKLLEMGSLLSVMPVISLIIQPEIIEQPGIVQQIHHFVGAPPIDTFVVSLTLTSCVLILFGNLCEFLVLRSIFYFCTQCERRLAADFMRECVNAPYQWLAQKHSVMLNRLFQVEVVAWGKVFLQNTAFIFNHFLTIFIGAAMVVVLAPATAIVALLGVGVVVVSVILFVRPKILHLVKEVKKNQDASTMSGSNLLTGSREFKFTANKNYLVGLFSDNYKKWAAAAFSLKVMTNVTARVFLVFGQLSILLLALAFWLSGVSSAEISAQMAVFLLITSRVIPAVTQLNTSFHSLWNTLPWIENICSTRDSIHSAVKEDQKNVEKEPPPNEWEQISFQDVSFSYDSERGRALDGVSMDFHFGKHYGLVGPSGSGKSTLIDLISCLLKPTSGVIEIDGKDLTKIQGDRWRAGIGYVSQHPFFSDDTIRNNIAYGESPEDTDDNRIWECLKLAMVDNVIRDLPQGQDTRLGERGGQLSGGQLQRLAIARALYKDPNLLILDEATNGLDAASERGVLNAIDSLHGKVTVVSVSHLDSAVASCDRIFTLDNGRLLKQADVDARKH